MPCRCFGSRRVLLGMVLGGLAGAAAPARPQDPPYYRPQGTWVETLRASREALRQQERAAGQGCPLSAWGTADFTLLAWIRTSSGGVIASKSSPDGPWACYGKAFLVHNGRLHYDIGCVGVFGANTPVDDGRWHQVAVAYAAAEPAVEFFVDGKLDGRAAAQGNPDRPEDIVRIGHIAPGFWAPLQGFQGDIDEVRFYNRRLSEEEIAAQYRQPPEGAPADCLGFWPFEREAEDASGHGNSGQVRGATATDGKIGKALHFDGNARVDLPNTQAAALQARERLWELVARDFPSPAARREMAREQQDHLWEADWEPGDLAALARRYAAACRVPFLRQQAEQRLAAGPLTEATWQAVRDLYHRSRQVAETVSRLRGINFPALRRAVTDLTRTFGEKYPGGPAYLARLEGMEERLPQILQDAEKGDPEALQTAEALVALEREALLSNPLLDFDRLLLVKRSENLLGLPQNWESNSSLPLTGYDNEIVVLSGLHSPEPRLETLFRPEGGRFVGDVDLHWDADRLLFSMPGPNGRWQVFELNADGTGLHPLPLIDQPDVDNYDACYLPNGNILFTSTAPFIGVPCVTGASHVANLYLLDRQGTIRRLTFEQDHDWCPTVLNDGRVLYLRWEYSDLPHYVSRILFHCNPDGTEQMAYYGCNSYWPNALFYARPVPHHPSRFVAIVGGHHDVPRMGELVLFDAAQGRREADGVVQRIPGYGQKVEPVIRDGLVEASWPKFLHPWPLSEKYFLVSAKPTPTSPWGLYLVDVFDNMLRLAEVPGYALLEPIPFCRREKPPVIPDRVQLDRKDAVVFLEDIYAGDGLRGVPPGTVKRLRLFTYHFAYHGMGGQVNRVGLDGPWDIKRVLGTVPVEPDGSAYFRIPANTPISVQPLDAEGQALQLMRSWMTAMPGEVLSCVGCHEPLHTAPSGRNARALKRPPSDITPWYGPPRGFSFRREVQPVLDRYCVGCHQGQPGPDGQPRPDFRSQPDVHPQAGDNGYNQGAHFPPAYLALRRFVRTPTMESDMHLLPPADYHAETTRLVQMLRKGHYGVELDAESWDRLITWIDLNTPAHGTWQEIVGEEKVLPQRDRRRAMDRLYAGIDEDPEALPEEGRGKIENGEWKIENGEWVGVGEGREPRGGGGTAGAVTRMVKLSDDISLPLVWIPPGEVILGDPRGWADEQPPTRVRVDGFWMGQWEVTNEQFACFDPSHDSRLENGDFLQFSVQERGYPLNAPRQPVCRVSWQEALAFCRWLSQKTGLPFTLPTEAQWEYACRAGTATPLWYGPVEADFSRFANLADRSLWSVDTFGWGLPSGAVPPWRPAIEGVHDGYRVSAPVGSFQPNPWGLYDMHGNVSEWTRSRYQPYPYREGDGRNDLAAAGRRVVRGGSWYDRPRYARSAYRLSYPAWQGVYDVGFRVICEQSRFQLSMR